MANIGEIGSDDFKFLSQLSMRVGPLPMDLLEKFITAGRYHREVLEEFREAVKERIDYLERREFYLRQQISSLVLPPRITKVLTKEMALRTILDLTQITRSELQSRGLGPKSIDTIKGKLGQLEIFSGFL